MAIPQDPLFDPTFETDPGRSGEFVTPEQQAMLLENPDARAARQGAHRAELPYPQPPLRGKKREFGFELRDDEPEILSDYDVVRLGTFLDRKGNPVLDELNKYYAPAPDPAVIERYITYAGARQQRARERREQAHATLFELELPKLSPEARAQQRLAKQRQSQIVADGLQRNLRNNIGGAELRQAALQSVRDARKRGDTPDISALRFAADAIEDVGYCLNDNQDALKGIPNKNELGLIIAYFGYYMAARPEIIDRQPLLLLLAQREQERRLPFWQARLDAMLKMDHDRRTGEYKASEQTTQDLIAQFLVGRELDTSA